MSDSPITRNDDPRDAVRRALVEIVGRHGVDVFDDPRRLRSMLADLAPFGRRDAALIDAAVFAGVPGRLRERVRDGVATPVAMSELAEEISRAGGGDAEAASWAIDAIASSMGLSETREDRSPPAAEVATPAGDLLRRRLPDPSPSPPMRPGFPPPHRIPVAPTVDATAFRDAAPRRFDAPVPTPTPLPPSYGLGTAPSGVAPATAPGRESSRRRGVVLGVASAVLLAIVVVLIVVRSSGSSDGDATVAPSTHVGSTEAGPTDAGSTDLGSTSVTPVDSSPTEPPTTAPAAITLPATAPPATAPPVTDPPATAPPATPPPPLGQDDAFASLAAVYPALVTVEACTYYDPSWVCGFDVDGGYATIVFDPSDDPDGYLDYVADAYGGTRARWLDAAGSPGGNAVLYVQDGLSHVLWAFSLGGRGWDGDVYWPTGDQAAMLSWWTATSSDRLG